MTSSFHDAAPQRIAWRRSEEGFTVSRCGFWCIDPCFAVCTTAQWYEAFALTVDGWKKVPVWCATITAAKQACERAFKGVAI